MSYRKTPEKMRKLGFKLAVEDGWPPYDVEHVWAEPVQEGYKIMNVPFYIKGISLDDVVNGVVDEAGYITNWEVVQKSPNSTIWILELDQTTVVQLLKEQGCDFERGDPTNLIAVNVPPSVDEAELFRQLEELESRKSVAIAVPSDRFSSDRFDPTVSA